MTTKLHAIQESGQSIWCDNISRAMIDGGELQRLIDLGVVGVTSNPTIFMKAITGGSDYDALLAQLHGQGKSVMEVYEGLVLPDIRDAAGILRPVYDRTAGLDGYVSLEVNPQLADDTDATVAEARRLHGALDRPNIFIKVPATEAGIPAIAALIGEGISVNVTLIFSISMYEKVMDAYLEGLARLDRNGGELARVASVASFFVSRVDTLVDKMLDEHGGTDALRGKAANANARLAYARFEEVFAGGGTFAALAAKGARLQRPLWASTSTKNPAYPDTLYVDPLVGPHTVNTLPPNTIEAVLDHGKTTPAIREGVDDARRLMHELAALGIDMEAVTAQLLTEGVASFARSFEELLANIEQKSGQLSQA